MRARYEQALAEVERMKHELRERAQHVAARERELEELRLELAGRAGRQGRGTRSTELAAAFGEAEKREREAAQEFALAQAERERLDERERTIHKVERELAGLRVRLEEERARLSGSSPAEPEPAGEPDPTGEPPAAPPPPPTPLPQPPPEPDLEPAAERH